MILLNFTHPLTDEQQQQIETLAGQSIERMIEAPAHFDHARPFADQVRELADSMGLTSAEWQQAPLLVNPPALSAVAVTLLAELHGRMGYFPPAVRLCPVEDALPPRYQVAEIINLQQQRNDARRQRQGEATD